MAEERIWEKAVNARRSEACSPGHPSPGSEVPLPRVPWRAGGGGRWEWALESPEGRGNSGPHTPANRRGTLAWQMTRLVRAKDWNIRRPASLMKSGFHLILPAATAGITASPFSRMKDTERLSTPSTRTQLTRQNRTRNQGPAWGFQKQTWRGRECGERQAGALRSSPALRHWVEVPRTWTSGRVSAGRGDGVRELRQRAVV